MHVIYFVVFGLIVGVIARALVPGREPGGWVMSILIGIAGSVVGGFLGRAMSFYGSAQPAGWLMSVVGAVVLLLGYHAISGRRAST